MHRLHHQQLQHTSYQAREHNSSAKRGTVPDIVAFHDIAFRLQPARVRPDPNAPSAATERQGKGTGKAEKVKNKRCYAYMVYLSSIIQARGEHDVDADRSCNGQHQALASAYEDQHVTDHHYRCHIEAEK